MAIMFWILVSSTGRSIEEVQRAFHQLGIKCSQDEAEKLLGKPFGEQIQGKARMRIWLFVNQSLDEVECYTVMMFITVGETEHLITDSHQNIRGRDAWLFRWYLLKSRLGLKVD